MPNENNLTATDGQSSVTVFFTTLNPPFAKSFTDEDRENAEAYIRNLARSKNNTGRQTVQNTTEKEAESYSQQAAEQAEEDFDRQGKNFYKPSQITFAGYNGGQSNRSRSDPSQSSN